MAEGDYYRLKRSEQREGLPKQMPVSLRKYIQGQRLLCDWLPYELSPEVVVKAPKDLYKLLSEIGFVWDKTRNDWRLDRRRNAPVCYFDYFEDKRL